MPSLEPDTDRDAEGQLLASVSVQWEGPLPPPAALKAFEDVHPGASAILIEEFRTEARHRRRREMLESIEFLIGRCSAILFGLAALAAAAFAAVRNAEWFASILGGGVIVGGMVALIKTRVGDPDKD